MSPRLLPDQEFLPATEHQMAPFSDHVLVRECYGLLYQQLLTKEKRGLQVVIVLGTPGVGVKAFVTYLIKRCDLTLQVTAASNPITTVELSAVPFVDRRKLQACRTDTQDVGLPASADMLTTAAGSSCIHPSIHATSFFYRTQGSQSWT